MSERAQSLARQLEQANQEMIQAVERCSDTQLKTTTAGEGWSVGVVAHHLAGHHA